MRNGYTDASVCHSYMERELTWEESMNPVLCYHKFAPALGHEMLLLESGISFIEVAQLVHMCNSNERIISV
jgi:hypothetical protein